ncbi:hypothetical protein [Pseudoroseicyclus aestuarii]|uniref:Uncharacterized protein n=1 Tax=Pseudoroseicyclus aestuarii TaxID=1795041 RepID=A0A318SQM2_9RHOB|nr:hypothetical protein [Pseudoroseicyclus aestuarii]PYE83982.1 hypothetical protein DFP88_103344 [Pseudoroseicyclus aestuarii]
MTHRLLTAAILALATAGGIAAPASAESTIGLRYERPTNYSVEFPVVRADQAGTLAVLRADGTVLGATEVQPGLNADVRVSWPTDEKGRFRAVLTDAAGTVLDERWVRLRF